MTVPFLSVRPRAIKLKVLPQFPALLIGRNGIAIDKESGNYFFDLDYTKMPFSPVLPPNNVVAVYDPASGHFTNIPATQLGGGITTDAPLDGFTYGRNNAGWARALDLALGGTVTGNVTFSGTATFGNTITFNGAATFNGTTVVPTPTAANQAANKGYVDAAIGTATPLVNGAAAVGVSAKWAHEDHVHPTDGSRAPVNSPALTGTPTAPTAPVDANTTQIATTAYVIGQASAAGDGTPAMDGAAARGVATHWARADHIHPTDTSRAPLASPALTGTPTAPTAAQNTNTTQVATTAFVLGQAATVAPLMDGAAVVGVSSLYARQDHVHPSDTTKIGDAPSDGNMYARKNATWSVITGGGGGGANVYVQDTAPVGATAGSLWWNSSNGQLYVYYYDGNSTQWVFAASGGPPSTPNVAQNKVVNGAMMISQENGTTVGTTNNFYPVDQYRTVVLGTTGVPNFAQVAKNTPAGSPNRLRVSVPTTADASVGAGDLVALLTKIEGSRVADLMLGTAAAKTVTLQFGVCAPAGTHCVTFTNGAATRSYVAEYTIAAGEANIDVVKSTTVALDTAGAWIRDATDSGLTIIWGLMVGSSFTKAAGAWGTDASGIYGSPNQFNVMGTVGNVFELFDVGLYLGSTPPSFQVPDYAQELAACKRYCYLGAPPARGLVATATTLSRMGTNHPVPMRTSPTLTMKGNINITDGVGATTVSSITTNYSSPDAVEFDANLVASLTAGRIGIVFQTGAGLFVNARM
ncbi:hypothetical protein [Bradyrhizobium diazoefficiens]|uniref:hypothetical protein n=1 Tax=Bradyrhizobium diazoefficiens TaxID=1355477 RepID=UPI002714F2C0|nr:hypothetical protein [Bradyrhizobium diazoefficiens]WLB34854.1 hypothetical protein QIH78_25570 [Bradyrhizobium diazoefficiens]BCF44588.1 hypothetical protein XF16B_50780 [Bradyrhizobium diazoefficiens]BCF70734.1 hypothetical protein XF19B_50870 [Bradyrhizobium diazoefficiens]